MNTIRTPMRLTALALVLTVVLAHSTPTAAQVAVPPAPPQADEGFAVQARGPVHEAYAVPAIGQPQAAPIILQQPPPPIEEEPPALRPDGNNVQWIAGYWAWDDEKKDFLWISGFWRDLPPGRQWVPGYWARLADGWQWVAGYWSEANQDQLQYLPPSPDSLDVGPSAPAPADDYSYVPGLWVYREQRYVWRPGYWLRFQPNWVWCPSRYVWTPNGCLYVSGYWDYPLQGRGLLFAPVAFSRPLWTIAGWAFQPRHVFSGPGFFGSLFVRPSWGSYYVGDYFAPAYAARGYTPWNDFRVGGFGHDPLYSYYRLQNRGDPRWEQNLASLYAGRRRGELPAPPRTFAQQSNVAGNTFPRNGNAPHLVTPLAQVDRSVVRLHDVSETLRREQRETSRHLHAVAQERRTIEAPSPERSTSLKPGDSPRVGRLSLPKPPVANPAAAVIPPQNNRPTPPQTTPPHVGRPPIGAELRPQTAVVKPPEHPPLHHNPTQMPPERKPAPLVKPPEHPPMHNLTPTPPERKPTPPAPVNNLTPPAPVRNPTPPPPVHNPTPPAPVIRTQAPPAPAVRPAAPVIRSQPPPAPVVKPAPQSPPAVKAAPKPAPSRRAPAPVQGGGNGPGKDNRDKKGR